MNSRLGAALVALGALAPLAASAQLSVSITVGPPPLPIYAQPALPGDGYIWTPGYWSWSGSDRNYYWVPGAWVLAPNPGYLWTPGYWSYAGSGYLWNQGYWADHVGFYGGINYGYGYTGRGYQGGRWDHGVFNYNTRVNNVDTQVVRHTYSSTVSNYATTRVSFNGGRGGMTARANAAELRVQTTPHLAPTANQLQHEHTALATPTQRAPVNRGGPQIAANARPAVPTEPGAAHARGEAPVRRAPVTPAAPIAGPQPHQANIQVPSRAHAEAAPRLQPQAPAPRELASPRTAALAPHPPITQQAQPRPIVERLAQPRQQAEPRQHAEPRSQPRQEAEPRSQPRQEAEPRSQPRQEAEPRSQPKGRGERE